MKFIRMGVPTLLIALVICIMFLGISFAGTVGKISGTVTDKTSNEGIPGVGVQLEGTSMGAAASFDGSYVILNVPPGTYNLVAKTIGFNQMTIKEVSVAADLTTQIDFELTSEAEQVEDVIVIAEKVAINKFVTSTEKRVTAAEIAHLPVSNVTDVLRNLSGMVTQAGVLHVRGSRGGEITFIVDGIEIKDVVGGYGSSFRDNLNIAATDISELSVLKGNFDAEYGGSNSAIINIVRKDGDIRQTSGRLDFLTDDLGFSELNKYSFNQDRLDWNLSGPVPALKDKLFPALGLKWPGENMAYFISFSADKKDTYIDYNDFKSQKSQIDYGSDDVLGIDVPRRRINDYTTSAKVSWKLDNNAKYRLSFNYYKSWTDAIVYDHNYLYSPSSAPNVRESKETMGIKFDFSPSFLRDTFGELKINRNIQKYEQKPGGLVPGDFVRSNQWEGFSDLNNNGQWDSAEPFIDTNGNGVFDFNVGETFTDDNGNGVWDEGEEFVDTNNNGIYDPPDVDEAFSDLNGNGVWDGAEAIINDHNYTDTNGNGVYDEGEPIWVDDEGNGNGRYDPQLRDNINEDKEEPFTDGDVVLGEPFIDGNNNGVYDGPGTLDEFLGAWDLNHNGEYDGPNDPWSPGVPYRDLNNNGRFDAPNGSYDLGEPYVDVNGNGRWDSADQFWDHGFDQWALYHKTGQNILTFDLNITSQVAKEHEIKAGIKYQDMTLEMNEVQYPYSFYDGAPDGGLWPDRGVFRDFYERKPKLGAFFFRDKMEYGEMIANLGFRYDFFLQANEVTDTSFASQNYQNQDVYNSQNQFSPRVAFSFPVSDKAKLYFNYGHFYQLPEFRYFYRRPTQSSSAAGIVGNPNLDFEKSISYEIGVQTKLVEDYIMTISGYYKDYYGLLNSIEESYGPISNDVYGNIDYARSRGLEFELEKRYGSFFAGSFQYEYAFAFGKNSSNSADYFRRFYQQEIPITERPLDWDIRHQITVESQIMANKGRHPKVGIFTMPDDWSLNFIWQFKSGKPFSPTSNYPGLNLINNALPLGNSKRMSYFSNVDMRLDKNFQSWKMNYTLTLRINNLFGNRNVNNVYGSTGLADSNQNNNGVIRTGVDFDKDPVRIDPGRQVQVGLSLNF